MNREYRYSTLPVRPESLGYSTVTLLARLRG